MPTVDHGRAATAFDRLDRHAGDGVYVNFFNPHEGGDQTRVLAAFGRERYDRLAALKPAMVVAGHKKSGVPDSPSAIEDTKRYLLDFDRLQKTATSDQELFDQMTELYPHWVANQSWLMFGFPGA